MEITKLLEELDLSFNFTTGGLGLLVYILEALALYTIARRRGIKKPWLAWIPVANVWTLGSISDQYQYVVNRQVKNKRKALLGLNIAQAALAALMIFAAIWLFGSMILFLIEWSAGALPGQPVDILALVFEQLENNLALLIVFLGLIIPALVLVIVQTVYFWMAIYDVFRSSDPNNKTLYLVLSLVGNLVVPGVYCVFLMLCMEKDLGMPPRKPEPEVVSQPISEPEEKTEE